jgi:hypothetical protein
MYFIKSAIFTKTNLNLIYEQNDKKKKINSSRNELEKTNKELKNFGITYKKGSSPAHRNK